MDLSLLGEVTAELMDKLPTETGDDARILAVGIVVVVDGDDKETYTRVKCSSDVFYEQLGLFHAALEVITTGDDPGDG